MYENRRNIQAHKFQVDLVDLEDYRHDHKGLLERLNVADAIWLGGGNTYYLRWILKTTGADSIITKLVQKGTVYGGGSAGAIIAGPTIDHFQTAEDPSKAPELILDGLGLIDVVVLPHWGNEKYGKLMEGIKSKLHDAKSETVEIRDTEAVIFENGQQTIIGI
jgi:dipeptidase E